MLSSVTLKNFGPLENICWENLANINLVLGGNGQGKTILLKAIYASVKSIENNGRGDGNKTLSELLSEKLYWTFQVDRLGELVRKPVAGPLSYAMSDGSRCLSFAFGQDTTKKITADEGEDWSEPETNSIFLPAKEVLSLQKIILKSREQDVMFGFDDTYLDLAKALRSPTIKGKNSKAFAKSRQILRDVLGGRIKLDEQTDRWIFRKGNLRFPIGTTSEGTKKTAILDTLLGNRYLSQASRVFIDEPEAALHPRAISELMDIIALLAGSGMQFFLATHSCFVIKKLLLIALKTDRRLPVLSLQNRMARACSSQSAQQASAFHRSLALGCAARAGLNEEMAVAMRLVRPS